MHASNKTEPKNGHPADSSDLHAQRPDLYASLAPWLALWREESERMVRAYDAMTEHAAREMRRNLDETHRWLGTQLDASRQMHAVFADAARRMNNVWRQS